MAFKRSKLKNWTVRRTITIADFEASFDIEIRIVDKPTAEEWHAEALKGSKDGFVQDQATAAKFVANVYDYQDEKDKDMTLEQFFEDVKVAPPAIIGAVVMECLQAQYDAASKN